MFFPTTHWSLLAKASLNGDEAGRQALEELCRRYWTPLNQFIRWKGYEEKEAEDLTQEFLLHMLTNSTFRRADHLRGKFRSFLLGALFRFLANECDRRLAQKRGQGAVHSSLDLDQTELATSLTPATVFFDREWALAILENVLRTLEGEYNARGEARQFEILSQFLPGSLNVPSYEDTARQLVQSLAAFKSELHRLRQRFKALVRQEIASTVSAPHEIEEEVEHLLQILMDRGSDLGANTKLSPSLS